MEVYFGDKQTARLYVEGRSQKSDPPAAVIERLRAIIAYMQEAESPQELRSRRALRYKKLRGDLRGLYSIRVHGQYRLTFREEVEPRPAYANVRLSKHYDE